MLLTQRIEEMDLPSAEKTAANYLLAQGSKLKGRSTRKIATDAYTTPATLVRLGQRLGYEGWTDFFEAFLEEREYLEEHFQNVDANRPFTPDDSQTAVANKIAALHRESISDTMSLLDYEVLEKAVDCMLRSRNIYLVAVSISLDCTWLFKRNMQRLGKTVLLESNNAEQLCTVLSATPEDCALIVTYSGSPTRIRDEANVLHEMGVPIILLTGLVDNAVRPLADYVLNVTTRERLYSKVGNFSTNVSVHLLLDILYSCYFAADYEKNWKNRLEIAQKMEQYRSSRNEIMREK